ncbi:MAG TPA: mannonate dehydratase [Bacillota bacterium]|nr:mannonate dehydratase [Bacillota bacterium]HOK69202.1 mannonate dehydratase [Bacillota bacterium]HPP84655.1 mannonate dehydratase [Bacillota bacterium]
MKMTFRWYGDNDPIPIEYIAQIPLMDGIVSAVYDVPPGKVWSSESILKIKNAAEKHGLTFEVVESVPVHEDIKLGKKSRDEYIEVYQENIRRLGKAGVKVICYNFMPVFDWLRSQLDYKNPDGSTSLVYRQEQILKMDPKTGDLSLPGWDASYTKEDLVALLDEYKSVDHEVLFKNLKYFLDAVIPVCEEYDVKMAIHPDDPPFDIFGLPRIITDEANLDRFLSLYDSPYNGLTLCTGSLGAGRKNDIPKLLRKYCEMGRVHFVHARNIKLIGDCDFNETAHPSKYGSLDMYEIMKILYDTHFDGYIRPDHGRMIWGETGKPGYGLYDRALGAVYLSGLYEAIQKSANLK